MNHKTKHKRIYWFGSCLEGPNSIQSAFRVLMLSYVYEELSCFSFYTIVTW